ncbi:hypothetical protein V8E51_018115 [Hyaloscypha variabilis]
MRNTAKMCRLHKKVKSERLPRMKPPKRPVLGMCNIKLETSSLLGCYHSSPPVCWVMVEAPPLTPHPVVLSCHIPPISYPATRYL